MTTPIIGNAFSLSFDTNNDGVESALASTPDITGEELMNRLVDKGFVAFQLDWEEGFTAQLAVEDDVIFLCEAADELRFFAEGNVSHYVHLGDGELEVASVLADGSVSMSVVHTPHLDSRFRRKYEFEASLSDYLSAWNSLIRDLKSRA